MLPTHARHVHEAMVHAEDALSEAKSRPTDCFVTYKPSKRRASMRERNVSCAGEIVAALKQNRFVLAFQPIMNAETGQPAMYEALLRIAGHDGVSRSRFFRNDGGCRSHEMGTTHSSAR